VIYNAVTLVSSDDPMARKNAKKGIVYMLISLIIIFLGVKFIEFLWTSFT
jgi:hypothetical protein